MTRSWPIWLAFALLIGVLLAAMGWISRATLRLAQDRLEAKRQAATEENVHLALWRMDAALAPLLADENARAGLVYEAFFRPNGREGEARSPGSDQILIPSPLLSHAPQYVWFYFQLDRSGRLTSPQIPREEHHKLAVPRYTNDDRIAEVRHRLDTFAPRLLQDQLWAKLPTFSEPNLNWVTGPLVPDPSQQMARSDLSRQSRAAVEFNQRSQAVQTVNSAAFGRNQDLLGTPDLPRTDYRSLMLTPIWLGDQLILARRTTIASAETLQGCVLDWKSIKDSLLASVQDLLPGADLLPVIEPSVDDSMSDQKGSNDGSRRLAALPVRLEAGPLPPAADDLRSPLRWSLILAWVCTGIAAASVGTLLWGVLRLSERRAAFVSAVTHELRTPLTTFQMYAEMLSDGMVEEETQRREYLDTLHREAGRLIHLVDNVLSYARLARGRGDDRTQKLSVNELLSRTVTRLETRALQASMQLVVEAPDDVLVENLETNAGAVEQILFNLVDNSGKYASAADDRRIHLRVSSGSGHLSLSVADHGPGIPTVRRRRLFRPFSKTVNEAAESVPGVGLGLALSRRLARQLGGRLFHDEQYDRGTRFTLRLPLDENTA